MPVPQLFFGVVLMVDDEVPTPPPTFSTKRFPINPTFDTITCKEWKVVDAEGKERITAFTNPDGQASVQWFDKDEKRRIAAATLADGTVVLPTKDENPPKEP